mgnify:CR=1 FL=1
MKKVYTLLSALTLGACAAFSQTLNVKVGSVNYAFPAQLTGRMLFQDGQSLTVANRTFWLNDVSAMGVSSQAVADNTVNATLSDHGMTLYIQPNQTANALPLYTEVSNQTLLNEGFGGLLLNFGLDGITHLEIESVDKYPLAGNADQSIITFSAPEGTTLQPGTNYYVATLPCDVSGGYRISIYRNGLVAHYFGVHQTIEAGEFISPTDLKESELEFDDPDAPLVEEERPGLNKETKDALVAYQKRPSEETKQALLTQMGIRYDKVVARKKAKLRELEREAKTPDLVQEMQDIVDEMVNNRDVRLEQQFLRLIDPRTDEDPTDQWMVLRGSSAKNAYVAYAPVTNAEYALFNPKFGYPAGHEEYPVVNVTLADCQAYCEWLGQNDKVHTYRLPSEEEWILAAGHMPKDVKMNSDHVERGLTSVLAYAQTTGACGGIDFWGNSWEWTTTTNAEGLYIVKGGSWDSSRDACRSEYSDDVREADGKYANVGFRVVRVDR